MTRRTLIVLGIAWCLGAQASVYGRTDEGDDFEQIPSCGGVSLDHALWQPSPGMLRVQGYAQTRRNFDGCLSQMRVEAWVQGVVMPTAINQGAGIAVSVYWSVPVPSFRTWHSTSKHWLINFGQWLWAGYGHGSAEVVPNPSDNEYATVSECSSSESICLAPGGGGPDSGSPLLIDLEGDGFALTALEDGVLFDLDADGRLDRVAWTRPDSDDVWLAMDRNGNGVVDDGSELFGNYTAAYPGQRERLAANGFDALRFLEGPDYGRSYGDQVIDRRDEVFGRLLFWRDANHNGLSEPGELTAVTATRLLSLDTDYKESRRRDRHGNEFRQRGTSAWLDGATLSRRVVYDVWLRIQR